MGISYIVINFSFISDIYFFFFLSSDLKFQQSVSFLIFWGVLSVNLPIHLFVFPSFFNIYANLNTVLFFSSNECLDRSKNGIKEDRSIKKYSQDMKIYASWFVRCHCQTHFKNSWIYIRKSWNRWNFITCIFKILHWHFF